MDYAMQLYNEFLENPRTEVSYHFSPRMQVSTTERGTKKLREAFEHNIGESIEDGSATGTARSPVQYISSNELAGSFLIPQLEEEQINGATYSANLGHLWPAAQVAYEFVERARENGVQFKTGREITDIITRRRHVSEIIVNGEERETSDVVCATGPWNKTLLQMVGLDLPIKHSLGPVLVLRPQTKSPHSMFSVKHKETGYYMRQNPDGTVFLGNNPGDYESVGTEYDPDDITDTVPEELRNEGIEVAERLFPYLKDANIIDEWVGVRSLTPNTDPIIGWTSIQGLSVVSYNASGIQLSPTAGKIIAEQILNNNPTEYYDSVSISRSKNYDDHW